MEQDRGGADTDLSVVVPAYNEAASLRDFLAEVAGVLGRLTQRYEIICIDDGSTDGTWAVLQQYHRDNERIKAVRFSRNFGKEAAITAGLRLARGRARSSCASASVNVNFGRKAPPGKEQNWA